MVLGLEFIMVISVILKDASIGSQIYDVFIYGHTHKKEESRIGKTVVLNPGTGHKKNQKYFWCI